MEPAETKEELGAPSYQIISTFVPTPKNIIMPESWFRAILVSHLLTFAGFVGFDMTKEPIQSVTIKDGQVTISWESEVKSDG